MPTRGKHKESENTAGGISPVSQTLHMNTFVKETSRKMKKKVYNPYLPSYEYIPDGEPHAFGDRIYIYGSHDRFNGGDFCLNDYVCYSAPVTDLSDWQYEGVIFRKEQDIRNQNIPADAKHFKPSLPGVKITDPDEQLNAPGLHAMWAPDVVKGLDGRYYLYYCMDFLPEIGVAVCDTPAGSYEFLGLVKHADGTPLGTKEGDLIQFDPGIFIDDDDTIYLYSGNAPIREGVGKGPQGSTVMTLEEDMLTLKTEPKLLLPDVRNSKGTGYEGHEFFEASSIRKINGRYYFVYSSVQSHELCYAISDRPDEGYTFGGTIVDIGDVFLNGRTEKDSVACFGNTHGGIECADGKWYVFYHRQTNRTNYSRQGCAEQIHFDENGHIPQVEITSCGLNGGPLPANDAYPANICCHLNANGKTTYSNPMAMGMRYPYLTQDAKDVVPSEPGFPAEAQADAQFPVQYVTNFRNKNTIGFKYFDCKNVTGITLNVRGKASGQILVSTTPEGGLKKDKDSIIDSFDLKFQSDDWTVVSGNVSVPDGVQALYLTYYGLTGRFDIAQIGFICK